VQGVRRGGQPRRGIITDANRIAAGAVRLQAGTLYTALDRLWSAGLVEADREEVADGRLRRYYRLTEAGAELLAAEADRRRASAAVAAQRLSARLAGDAA
jgi:DNA-binding PadR family transcriptional regulator